MKMPLIAAHRGASSGNVPCNTWAAYEAGLAQGADIIEIDVSKSADGELFTFHPRTEPVFLHSEKLISEMTADEVRKLRFYNYDDSWLSWVINILDTEETTGDVLNDAVWDRNNRMEETYNCQISQLLDRNPADQLAALVQSGDTGAEIVMIYDEQIVNHYTAGRLLTWDVLPHVDFEHPWWSWNATQTFNAAGKVYAATGDFSLAQSTRSFILMFNKDMYADLGLQDDLYQLVQDG